MSTELNDERQLRKKRDHELIELLNELRIVLPGVQVLFAFLLIVPFSTGFDTVTDAQRGAYMVALAATVLGAAFLIAPTAYHRLRWRERNKDPMSQTSNRLAIAGLACVAIAMTSSVFLVTAEVIDATLAAVLACVSAAVFALAWFVLPLTRSYERWDEPPTDSRSGPSPTSRGRSAQAQKRSYTSRPPR